MNVFLVLILKLIPLYALIALGYIAGRFLQIQKEAFARTLIYIIAPAVIFIAVMNAELSPQLLLLPVIFLGIACSISLMIFRGSRSFCPSPERNILAFSAGSGNTGYFGFPLVIATMGENYLGIAALMALGLIIFENTLGFYLTARGRHTAGESFLKVAKLPTIYAFLLAVILNFSGVQLSSTFKEVGANFGGAYTVLGMMLIGLGISGIRRYRFQPRYLALTFLGKFVIWPLVVGTFILLDMKFFGLFSPEIHRIQLLMSIVPLPANSVAVATELNAEPEQAATAVFLSTAFVLIYIPIVLACFPV